MFLSNMRLYYSQDVNAYKIHFRQNAFQCFHALGRSHPMSIKALKADLIRDVNLLSLQAEATHHTYSQQTSRAVQNDNSLTSTSFPNEEHTESVVIYTYIR